MKINVESPYSCHELFGFDIMLDENLKPWILEVNISPRWETHTRPHKRRRGFRRLFFHSLHSNTALDVSIKGQMVKDLLNLAGFRLPRREDVMASCSSTNRWGRRRSAGSLPLTVKSVKNSLELNQLLCVGRRANQSCRLTRRWNGPSTWRSALLSR